MSNKSFELKEHYTEDELREILDAFSDALCANYSDKFILTCAKDEVTKKFGKANPFHTALEIINICGGVENLIESKEKEIYMKNKKKV